MNRLLQFLFIAVWIAGAVLGRLPVQPPVSAPEDESLYLLVNTDHTRLGMDRTQIVLTVETPWRSEWRATAPMPKMLVPNRSEESPSASQSEVPAPSLVPFVICSFASLL